MMMMMMMMESLIRRRRRRSTSLLLLFLVFCIVVVLQFQGSMGQNVAQNEPEHPLLPKFMMDTVSLLRRSHKNYWEKMKSIVHDLQMQFSPPTLDFRGGKEGEGMNGVKEAVGKSFDKSKETVKGAAESAAQVVHSTAQKIKSNTPSASASEQESKAEL